MVTQLFQFDKKNNKNRNCVYFVIKCSCQRFNTMSEFPFHINEWVDVLDNQNNWWQAIIMNIDNTHIGVHFHGFSDRNDETIAIRYWQKKICALQTHTCAKVLKKDGVPIKTGDVVTIGGRVTVGVVINIKDSSYVVRTPDGCIYHKQNDVFEAEHHNLSPEWIQETYRHHCIYFGNQKKSSPLFEAVLKTKIRTTLQTENKEWIQEWKESHIQLPHSDIKIVFDFIENPKHQQSQNLHDLEMSNHGEKKMFTIHAHRSVLAMRSKYFDRLFFGSFADSDSHVCEISINLSSVDSIKAVLFFIYYGQTQIPNAVWAEIYHLSLFLQIEDLQMQLDQQKFRPIFNCDNMCELWEQAQMYDLLFLNEQIQIKFEEILSRASKEQHQQIIEKMSYSMFQKVIHQTQQSGLFFKTQQHRFLFAMEWKQYHKEVDDTQFAENLRHQIYWAEMTPSFLVNDVKPNNILSDQQLFNVMMAMDPSS